MSDLIKRIVLELDRVERATAKGLALVLRIQESDVLSTLTDLINVGLVRSRRAGGGKRIVYELSIAGSKASVTEAIDAVDAHRGRHRLAMFRVGEGEKRDECAHYESCRDAFAREHDDETDGHCPSGCIHYRPEPTKLSRLWHDSAARKEWA